MADPYTTLGVKRTASADEIRTAYRKLAKKMHPDLHPGDKSAEEKFKNIAAAYDILGDTTKRARFDRGELDAQGNDRGPFSGQRGRPGPQAGPRSGPSGADPRANEDFSEFFESFFGGFQADRSRATASGVKARGPDARYRIDVELLDALRGGKQRITLPSRRSLEVMVPPGVETGQLLRLHGQGEPGYNGGPPGDALFEVTVKPHAFLIREGSDLKMDLPISVVEAIEGAQIEVPTPTGLVNLTIRAGTNSGTILRLRGKGSPNPLGGGGDLLVRVLINVQDCTDDDLRNMLKKWKGRTKTPSRPSSL